MADYEDEEAPANNLHPLLEQFRGGLPEGAIQDWGDEAAHRAQTFIERRQISQLAEADGEATVANLAGFKNTLVGMADRDPSLTPLALDMVPDAIKGIVDAAGIGDEHATSLTEHIQSEIARAGVQSWAKIDETAARQALVRHGGHLNEADHTALSAFIDTMATARAADARAAGIEGMRLAQEASDGHAENWLSMLHDPQREDVQFPQGWLSGMAADPRVKPETKADLWNAHDRLLQNGDQPSDPFVMMNAIRHLTYGDGAKSRDLYPLIGDGLSLTDAGTLAAAAKNKPFMMQLQQTIEAAGRQLAPNGDIAETRALGRFVDWLIPEVRNGANLDPKSKDWLMGNEGFVRGLWSTFKAQGDDLVSPLNNYDKTGGAVGPRISLHDIFGKRRAPAGDTVLPARRSPPVRIPEMTTEPGYDVEGNPGNPEIKS